MARSTLHRVIAAVLLTLTEVLSLVLGTPGGAVTLPPVQSLHLQGWSPGTTLVNYHVPGTVRLIQQYISTAGDSASVESRCSSDPKDFLKWSGKLAYLGAGFEQLSSTTASVTLRRQEGSPSTATAELSRVVLRAQQNRVLSLYGYLDHWGVHAQTAALWPRALSDLLTRHAGPYCMLGISVTVDSSEARANDQARTLARAFLAVLRRAVRS